jgi:uncharacterized integral membrane protein
MKQAKLITVIVLAVLGIVVALQNRESVATELLFVTVTMPRAVLLFITLFIGFITGIFATLYVSKRWTKKKTEA